MSSCFLFRIKRGISIKVHSTESTCVIGPEKTLFTGCFRITVLISDLQAVSESQSLNFWFTGCFRITESEFPIYRLFQNHRVWISDLQAVSESQSLNFWFTGCFRIIESEFLIYRLFQNHRVWISDLQAVSESQSLKFWYMAGLFPVPKAGRPGEKCLAGNKCENSTSTACVSNTCQCKSGYRLKDDDNSCSKFWPNTHDDDRNDDDDNDIKCSEDY